MVCRVCLKVSECCLEIFDVNGEQLGIADILHRHFWFQLLPSDSISTVICRICWLKVSDFHQFYLAVEQAHSLLNSVEVKHETTSVIGKIGGEIKEELHESHHANPNVEDAANPLYESEFDNNENEVSSDEQCESTRKEYDALKHDGEETTEIPKTRRPKRKYEQKNSLAPKKIPESETEDKNGASEYDEDSDWSTMVNKDRSKQPKVSNSNPQDDAMVKKHIAMGCDLCPFVGENFAAMRKHFRLQHAPIKAYIKCCNKKLHKRNILVQHAYKHEDPEFFKCKECQKVFAEGRTLKSHMTTAHAPEEELIFACDKCPKKFPRKHMHDLHRATHVPRNERTFVCEQCPNSRFGSNHWLKIHISQCHRRATNVCHVCAKEIRVKSSFEKHVRLHFEDSGPRLKCPLPDCDRWLKDEGNLRQHMRRHNEEARVFTCDECGYDCKNRSALHNHINYHHSNKVFNCEECNKTFKKAITLREHMAKHAGESLYRCPFCTRTFNSHTYMYSHKKKMHPVEWCKAKREGTQQSITKSPNSF